MSPGDWPNKNGWVDKLTDKLISDFSKFEGLTNKEKIQKIRAAVIGKLNSIKKEIVQLHNIKEGLDKSAQDYLAKGNIENDPISNRINTVRGVIEKNESTVLRALEREEKLFLEQLQDIESKMDPEKIELTKEQENTFRSLISVVEKDLVPIVIAEELINNTLKYLEILLNPKR